MLLHPFERRACACTRSMLSVAKPHPGIASFPYVGCAVLSPGKSYVGKAQTGSI